MSENKGMENAHDAVFDNIMRLVGDDGKFQRTFNYIFNVGLVLVGSMTYMNILMVYSEPEHWCHVPGRELTNFSTEKWRDITLPRDMDSRGIVKFSPCKMYNITVDVINDSMTIGHFNETDIPFNHTQLSITDCHYGYEYNRTWYRETPISKENWVCERELYATNALVLNRIGEVFGTFVFGQLGDTLGRRIVFYISLIIVVGGRLLTIVTTSNYTLFLIVAIVSSVTSNSIFQSPLIIAMETSKSDDRAYIAMLQSIGWTLGVSIMPLVFWLTQEWISFLLLTTLPCCIFFLLSKIMIESPRWLANKGRLEQCAEELNKIAKMNGKSIKITEKKLNEMLPKLEVETVYGMMSLFSSWRIAKNTIVIVICWVAANMSYNVSILNNSKMEGNPFLNFFFQSIVELPAYVIGKILGDTIGRRYTNVLSFTLAGIASLMNIFVVLNPSLSYWTLIFIIIIKFFASITFYVVNLQSMETYPTCLRQTGISIGGIIASGLGAVGPYVVYLGTAYDARFPHLIVALCLLVGAISALFLPETLHQKLPETLEEAKLFGADQEFWTIPKPISNPDKEFETLQKLNQIQYAN